MSTLSPSLSDLIGQPVQNIDTPALVVDLDAMNRNLGCMESTILQDADAARRQRSCPFRTTTA
ncbi:MAG: hypothetical protein NTZ64_07085 [Polaromonas sp.]|nr:hypothetical protein [Polaromonas sp.]